MSGTGKSTLVNNISRNLGIKRIITTTSRAIRNREINHYDYHFISKKEFKEKIQQKYFLEYIKKYNNYYGTALDDFDQDCVATLSIEGAEYINNIFNDVIIIYLNCSFDICKERLMLRDHNDTEEKKIIKRLGKDIILYSRVLNNCFVIDASMSEDKVLHETISIIKNKEYNENFNTKREGVIN